MRASLAEPKVVVSAAVEPELREELERLAREGDRTLSQQVRMAVREHLHRSVPPPLASSKAGGVPGASPAASTEAT